MSLFETVRIALRALRRNKMRSLLTMLGIVIGVGSVIAMTSIGEGARRQVEDTFAKMGTNLLVLIPGASHSGGARSGFGGAPSITWADVEAIRANIPSVRALAPQLHASVQLITEEQNWKTSVFGSTSDYLVARAWEVEHGRDFDETDVDGAARVVILGQSTAEKLFGPGIDPVGRNIRIRNVSFEVIGLLEAKGQSASGQDHDDIAIIPVSTFQMRIHGGKQNYISGSVLISTWDAEDTKRAERQIKELLRERHRIPQGVDNDFWVRNLAAAADAREASARTFTLLLASIAAVSLLVGGIGIMNIMLVSVTERTREIGIRMAVGATPRDILSQFLVESVVLSILGGLLGLAVGAAVASRLGAAFGWSTIIGLDVVLIAISFSAAVGIGFGLYPARKASRLDPIEALRFE